MNQQIYFVTLRFDRQIHAPSLGFTYTISVYARGENASIARHRAVLHYKGKYGLETVWSMASLAKKQDINKYAFPEQII